MTQDELSNEDKARWAKKLRERGLDVHDNMSADEKESYEKLNIRNLIEPAPDPLNIYSNNPLTCGTILFDLKLLTEEAGMTFTNHHQSIMCMAYLYNALLQTKLLDTLAGDGQNHRSTYCLSFRRFPTVKL